MATIQPQNFPKYLCEFCDIKTNNKKDYRNHLLTRKHQNKVNQQHLAKSETDNAQIFPTAFICNFCNKEYESRSGLWRHKKNCINPKFEPTANQINILTNLVLEVVKNNSELLQQNHVIQKQSNEIQKQMLEVCKVGNTNINNHSNNKTFNMQFFLNEQCKDAMNIMDFVDTFKLEFSDLERVGEVGYVEGISGIIIKKLNEMDIYKRPIHCSDAKRETMFVKDKNVWEKENGNHDKLRLAIRHITKKNTDMLLSWCHTHPGSCDSDNYLNDLYLQMVQQAMGAGNIEENENKIMRKIARTVLIDKENTF